VITKEELNAITQNLDKQVKKAVEKFLYTNGLVEDYQRDYFKDTEKLLYAYPDLKLKVEQDMEDLKSGVLAMKVNRSKDIIRLSANSGSWKPEEYVQEEIIRSRKASMERTRLQVQRIDRALETIKDDQYYDIIPMRYFDRIKIEEIADRLVCDESTVRRNKNRLVNKIKIVLFGADAL
jgi:RNA polymerase sigma factor (sigma-70 family)